MDKSLLLDAAKELASSGCGDGDYAHPQAVRQFNALLGQAKLLYPSRPDITCIEVFTSLGGVESDEYRDSVHRLKAALELRPPGTVSASASEIMLPPDATDDLHSHLEELKEAA